jgi:Uma2 family endonuclease
MHVTLSSLPAGTIVYPDSDGKPMADNTKQARWIVVLFDNLQALFAGRDNVFIAADHFWYPVEGEPRIRQAPDVFVVFGRPPGDRGSYKQWEEGDVPVTVAFEVLSPSNTYNEMADKLDFYDTYGVEEYYVYDPDNNRLDAYLRKGTVLRRARSFESFVSPRLGIRFQMTAPEMTVYRPDGGRFLTFTELESQRVQAEQARQQAEQARQQAQQGQQQAEQGRQQAEERAAQAEAEVERLRRLLEQAGRRGEPGEG